MSSSQHSSSDVAGGRSTDSAVEGCDESGRLSPSASWSTSRSELEDAPEAQSPVKRELASPNRQPGQRPESLSLAPPSLPPAVGRPLAQLAPTSPLASPLSSATSLPLELSSPTTLTPSSTEGEPPSPSAKPRRSSPLYKQYKELVARAQREACEGEAGSRSKRLRPRPSLTPSLIHEFPTDYKSKPYRRKKVSGSKRPLTGKHHPKGRQAVWAAVNPPLPAAGCGGGAAAASPPSLTSDVRSTSKSSHSPSAGSGSHAIGASHQWQHSAAATPATSTREQPQGGSGGKTAPARHSTTPRKNLQLEKSRRKDLEIGGKQLVKSPQLSPCKVTLTRLPSSMSQSTGSLWTSRHSDGAVTETSQKDVATGPAMEEKQGIPLAGGLVTTPRIWPSLKGTASTGGTMKKRKDRLPLKAAILGTTPTGKVVKKGRGKPPLKTTILGTTSADRQPSSVQPTVNCPIQQKARNASSPQKNTVLSISTTTPVTSDLVPGTVKKRKDRLPLKAAILGTTSTGKVVKKGRGGPPLKAATLGTTSADRQASSVQLTVNCPIQQKARNTSSPQKNTVLSISTTTHVTSDLVLGTAKKRKDRLPLKATIFGTTSTGKVVKKGRGRPPLKAATLGRTSADRQASSVQPTVNCTIQQKARNASSPQKNTVSSISTSTSVTSDLVLCPQRTRKLTPPFSAQKPKRKCTAKEKVPSLRKQSRKSDEASKHQKKPSDVLCQTSEYKAPRVISKLPKEKRRKTSVGKTPLKTVSVLQPNFQDKRQSATGLSLGSLESPPERLTVNENILQRSSSVPAKVGKVSPKLRSKRSAALLARRSINYTTDYEAEEDAEINSTLARNSSPPWKLKSGSRHPICWPSTTSRHRGRGRKARGKRQILLQDDDGRPSGSGTSPSTIDNSISVVLDDMLQTVDSMNSVHKEMKPISCDKVVFSSPASAAPPLDETKSSLQEPQPTLCNVDTDDSITIATNQPKVELHNLTNMQTSSTPVKEPRGFRSSPSQPDSDATVQSSSEVTVADVVSMLEPVSEAEGLPRRRSSSLECDPTTLSPYSELRGRSRSSSPSAAVRNSLISDSTDPPNSDSTRAQFGVMHWKKLMRLPSDEQQRGMPSDEDQRETEHSVSAGALTENVATQVGGSSVSGNTAGDGCTTSASPGLGTSNERCELAGGNLPLEYKGVEILPSSSSKFHTSWTGYEFENSEDNAMPIDLSLSTGRRMSSIPEIARREHTNTATRYFFPVQDMSNRPCEPAGGNDFCVEPRGVGILPPWSLKFDTSRSGRGLGTQEDSGEGSTAIGQSLLTTHTESSIPETPYRVDADSTTRDGRFPTVIPVQQTVEERCEPTRASNLPLQHRRVAALSSRSLHFDTSRSESEMEIQEESGEALEQSMGSLQSESPVPEMLRLQHERSIVSNPSTSCSQSFAKERASSEEDLDLLYDICDPDSTRTISPSLPTLRASSSRNTADEDKETE